MSAGGYHHHMAMNTWNSRRGRARPLALGLGLVSIEVPTSDDVGALGERLAHYGVPDARRRPHARVEDPWANQIRIVPAPAA